MYTKEQLQQYADRGLSISETSLELEADRTSINRYAKKFGVIFVKKRRKLNEEITNKIRQMIDCDKTNRQIVEELGICTATVSRIRRGINGLESRPRKNKQVTVEENKKSTKVRNFDLAFGDDFEVIRNLKRKKQTETFKIIQLTSDLIVGVNSIGLVESFQKKEYEYGLI